MTQEGKRQRAGWELEGLTALLWLHANQLLLCAADRGMYFDRWDVGERIQTRLPWDNSRAPLRTDWIALYYRRVNAFG